ncbi:MAG: 2-C-methyl-D-erythritol 2,4-cyclodiphosphate synthase, partial [Pseudomonadota bacterium]|nr:2-C-methyl-D-erythritol 2,4-cyclodiphosphate synthase [Pseudomonadota bacterium]
IGEIPNISNSKNKIVKNLSKYLKINEELISLKATTTDKLGFIGKKEGVACLANVLIHKA